jgi:cytochrome b561
LPEDFWVYAPRAGHGITATVLILLIALHVGAALYHQFIRKDNLLARMWFGKR